MLPSTRCALRRMFLAGVLSQRLGRRQRAGAACGQDGSQGQRAGLSYVGGETGKAPQAAANPKSVCMRPPKSSAS